MVSYTTPDWFSSSAETLVAEAEDVEVVDVTMAEEVETETGLAW